MLCFVFTGSVIGFTAFMDSTKSLTSTTIFNKVLFNEGGGYDRSTGVFTCPIGGVYLFSFVGGMFSLSVCNSYFQ